MGITRRGVLRVGALSAMSLASARGAHAAGAKEGKAKACIFIFLQGGPSHHDLWDPKPEAPAEIRGPFTSISTQEPNITLAETLPKTAAIADRICLVRSMTHAFNNHIAGTYIMHTGDANQPNIDREAAAKDFPGPGAILNYLSAGGEAAPVSVSLPNWLSIPGPSNRMPGQYGGLLGSTRDPLVIEGDPASDKFRPLSLSLPPELSIERLQSRSALREAMDAHRRMEATMSTHSHERMQSSASRMLANPLVREALDLSRESDATRDRYGRDKMGQSFLLARRLVEAGVRWVAYNEFNQGWDHHGDIGNTLKHRGPPLDAAYAALIGDLAERGLLAETLVVCTGEFGRTPLINNTAGRDHWPNAYTSVLAGGGIRGGYVHGASDRRGAEVANAPVSPADLLATIWSALGVDPRGVIFDRLNRPLPLCGGEPIRSLFA